MKVVFLCGGYRASYGGSFIASLQRLEVRLNSDACVYVFHKSVSARPWCKVLMQRGAAVAFLDFDAPVLTRIKDMLALIDRLNPDIIHVHFGEKVTPSICGLLRPSICIFEHIHSDWSMGRQGERGLCGLTERFRRSVIKLITHKNRKIAVSEKLAVQNGAVYVPNGIDCGRIYRTEDPREAKRKLGLNPEGIAVLVFGWSPEVKGVDIAAEAVGSLCRNTDLHLELLIVTGENPDAVRQWLSEHTVCDLDFIHFLPPAEDVYRYHDAADIYLSASRSEGFSYTLCEALSIAKPCVSSDIPGVKWARDFKSVVFFESGDVQACAQAIMQAADSLQDAEKIHKQESDSKRIISEYSAEIWADRISELYSDCRKDGRGMEET